MFLDQKYFRMLVLWLEENILHVYKPDERDEMQNIDSSTWDTTFKNYCVTCSCPIKSTVASDQLEWLLGMSVRKVYKEQSKLLFNCSFKNTFFKLIDLSFVIFRK